MFASSAFPAMYFCTKNKVMCITNTRKTKYVNYREACNILLIISFICFVSIVIWFSGYLTSTIFKERRLKESFFHIILYYFFILGLTLGDNISIVDTMLSREVRIFNNFGCVASV